jgi:vacuolar protein 8
MKSPGKSHDGLYEPVLAESEREAVADLLQYLENVRPPSPTSIYYMHLLIPLQRGETDFFSGEPLRALSTLVFSDNVDLQRSASLTFAEITERGTSIQIFWHAANIRDYTIHMLSRFSL